MSNIFQLNREQLKALLALCAIHAPSFAEAQAVAERVITELENSDTITNRLVRGMAQPEPIVAAFLAGTAKPETHDDFMLLANEALRQMDIINHHLRLINTPKHEPADAVSDVPSERVNMPDPENDGARIIGFRIREGDAAWGKYGLSEPLAWLEDFTARHARGVQADAVSDDDVVRAEDVYWKEKVVAKSSERMRDTLEDFAARHARGVPELSQMNDDLLAILGKPNFVCGPYAHLMKQARVIDIPAKSEVEQAHVLLWLLRHYLASGAAWADAAASDVEKWTAMLAAQPTKEADQ